MVTKIQLISNVLTMKKYARIGIVSGVGLGIIYYYLTMSMLPTHFDVAIELAPHYIITSIGLTIVISTLAGINFAMMAYKINQMKKIVWDLNVNPKRINIEKYSFFLIEKRFWRKNMAKRAGMTFPCEIYLLRTTKKNGKYF